MRVLHINAAVLRDPAPSTVVADDRRDATSALDRRRQRRWSSSVRTGEGQRLRGTLDCGSPRTSPTGDPPC